MIDDALVLSDARPSAPVINSRLEDEGLAVARLHAEAGQGQLT